MHFYTHTTLSATCCTPPTICVSFPHNPACNNNKCIVLYAQPCKHIHTIKSLANLLISMFSKCTAHSALHPSHTQLHVRILAFAGPEAEEAGPPRVALRQPNLAKRLAKLRKVASPKIAAARRKGPPTPFKLKEEMLLLASETTCCIHNTPGCILPTPHPQRHRIFSTPSYGLRPSIMQCIWVISVCACWRHEICSSAVCYIVTSFWVCILQFATHPTNFMYIGFNSCRPQYVSMCFRIIISMSHIPFCHARNYGWAPIWRRPGATKLGTRPLSLCAE